MPKQGQEILAHWTYTHDEWRRFVKWKLIRKSYLHYFFHLIKSSRQQTHPEVRIGSTSVWTNHQYEPFDEQDRKFRKVLIHEAGNMNILEISFDKPEGTSQIRIPIPKGKLREAIAVQERIADHQSALP